MPETHHTDQLWLFSKIIGVEDEKELTCTIAYSLSNKNFVANTKRLLSQTKETDDLWQLLEKFPNARLSYFTLDIKNFIMLSEASEKNLYMRFQLFLFVMDLPYSCNWSWNLPC